MFGRLANLRSIEVEKITKLVKALTELLRVIAEIIRLFKMR